MSLLKLLHPAALLLFPLLLLLILLQAASCEVVTDCEGFTCLTATPRIPLNNTSKPESILFAQCHAACLEEVGMVALKQEAKQGNTAWPTIPLEILSHNCRELSRVFECRRGCITRNSRPSFSRSECRTSCKADCNSNCLSGDCQYQDTNCAMHCNDEGAQGCKEGCKILTSEPTTDDGSTVADPVRPPVLREEPREPSRPPGRYDIEYNVSSVNGTQQQKLGGILFQIQSASATYYQFKTSFSGELLDLGSLACQSVNLSFAVVTRTYITSFSPPTKVCVYGGFQYPPQLNIRDVNIITAVDGRSGFSENAVVHISWPKPINPRLVENYTLELFTNDSRENCASGHSEKEIFTGIPASATSFTIQAGSPQRAPRIFCGYQYSIEVLLRNPSERPAVGYIRINTPDIIPDIELTCTSHVNEVTGRVTAEANWRIVNHELHPVVVDAVGSYRVTYRWEDSTITQTIEALNVGSNPQDGSGTSVVEGISPREGSILLIEVEGLKASNGTPSFLIPEKNNCRLADQVAPVPPDTIDGNTVYIKSVKYELGLIMLVLEWEDPQRPYGNVSSHQVRLLTYPARSSDDVDETNEIAATGEDEIIIPGQDISLNAAFINETSFCLYVQVRVRNEFLLWSQWSDSVPVLLDSDTYLSCEGDRRPITEGAAQLPVTTRVGIAVGCLAFILLAIPIASLCVCICKRHRMKMQMKKAFENGYANPVFMAGGVSLRRRNSSMRTPLTLTVGSMELDDWEIPVGSVIVDTKFGEGCFGEVHRGVVRGPLPTTRTMKSNICVTVAIKMLKTSATGSERTDFLHEIDTMKKIAEGNNPHIINFIGCVTIQEPLCLITEFVKYGDLLSYLETIRKLVTHKNRQRKLARIAGLSLKEPEPYLVPQSKKPPEAAAAAVAAALLQPEGAAGAGMEAGWGGASDMGVVPSPDSPYADLGGVDPVNLISFAYQIASGMEYLASLDIVHRDLACRNILIGENKSLKISDFGMSRVVCGDDIYVKTTKGRLPWKWMAIESIVNREFTHQSDVWAYGVTLWEIATLGGFPYPMISNAELLDHLKNGFRLECPENCCPEIYKVMLECWSEDPNDRQTFPELRSLFDTMLAENNQYIQFDNINTHKPYYNTQSRRNSCLREHQERAGAEGEEASPVLGLSESEISTSTSSVTLNGASASEAYDFLRPLVPRSESVDTLDEQQAIQMANPYVETPTFKYLMNQEGLELSNFELELERIRQATDEMESSAEVQVEINSSANSAVAVE